jgi:hypothetical protein
MITKIINALVKLFHKHKWAYALGVSPGVLSGNARPLCFRRACPDCGRREEIEHYGHAVTVAGVEYMADPQWREIEEGCVQFFSQENIHKSRGVRKPC